MKSGIYRYKWLCILSLLIIVGCSQKATVNPDEMIKTDYAQYEQVAINEDDSGQIRLLKRDEIFCLYFKKMEMTLFLILHLKLISRMGNI